MTFADVQPGRRIRAGHILELQDMVGGFQDQLDAIPEAEDLVDMQADIDGLKDGTVPVPLAGIADALGAYEPLVNIRYSEYNVLDYDAVPGSVAAGQRTLNTVAIQAAADAARDNDGTLVIKGSYELDGTLTFRSHVDADSGELIAYGTAASTLAVRVGSTTASDETFSKILNLPTLTNAVKSGAGWTSLGVGYEFASLYSCHVRVPHILGFSANALLTSYSTGNVYNQYHFGWLDNGKINCHLAPGDTGGWVNENEIHIGRASHDSGEGTNVSGVRHIKLEQTGTYTLDNNVFMKPSIEGDAPEYHVEFNGAVRNLILQGRWEASPPKVLFHNSTNNVIMHGYRPPSYPIVRTQTGTSAFNELWDIGRRRLFASGTSGGTILENPSNSAYASLTIMDAGADIAGSDTSTAYAAQVTAQKANFKQSSDAYPRVQIDYANGRIYYCNGVGAPAIYLGNFGTVGLQASTYFRVGTAASLPTASSSYRGMMIRVEGGAGVADAIHICQKNAADGYEWQQVKP